MISILQEGESIRAFLRRHIAYIYFGVVALFFIYGFQAYFTALLLTLPFAIYAYKRLHPELRKSQIAAVVFMNVPCWLILFAIMALVLPYPLMKPEILWHDNFRRVVYERYPDGTPHKKIYGGLKRQHFEIIYSPQNKTYYAMYESKESQLCRSDYRVSWTVNNFDKITLNNASKDSTCLQ